MSQTVSRFKAEGYLGQGQWLEAKAIFEAEAETPEPPPKEEDEALSQRELSEVLQSLRNLAGKGKDISKSLTELLRVAETVVREHPIGAALVLERRWLNGSLTDPGLAAELDALCQAHPSSIHVCHLAEQICAETGHSGAAQLASLMSSKLTHGSGPGPTGAYLTSNETGSHVLVDA